MLTPSEYTNHSGGALGADTAWEVLGIPFGVVNHKHYWLTNITPKGNTEMTFEESVLGQMKVTLAARMMGRIEPAHQSRSELLIRNWNQVDYSEEIFAIGKLIPPGYKLKYGKVASILQVLGGTGYAVQMGIMEGKTVHVFDQDLKIWMYNKNNKWLPEDTPILTKNFAGIGTRDINQYGLLAIEEVYNNTLNTDI